jgi:hypothetical protein
MRVCCWSVCLPQDAAWVKSARVSSEDCSVLWIPLALFEFAYEPNSMEDTVTGGGTVSDDSGSDEENEMPPPQHRHITPIGGTPAGLDPSHRHVPGNSGVAEGTPSLHGAVAQLQKRLESHERQLETRLNSQQVST